MYFWFRYFQKYFELCMKYNKFKGKYNSISIGTVLHSFYDPMKISKVLTVLLLKLWRITKSKK